MRRTIHSADANFILNGYPGPQSAAPLAMAGGRGIRRCRDLSAEPDPDAVPAGGDPRLYLQPAGRPHDPPPRATHAGGDAGVVAAAGGVHRAAAGAAAAV